MSSTGRLGVSPRKTGLWPVFLCPAGSLLVHPRVLRLAGCAACVSNRQDRACSAAWRRSYEGQGGRFAHCGNDGRLAGFDFPDPASPSLARVLRSIGRNNSSSAAERLGRLCCIIVALIRSAISSSICATSCRLPFVAIFFRHEAVRDRCAALSWILRSSRISGLSAVNSSKGGGRRAVIIVYDHLNRFLSNNKRHV